MSKKTIFVFVAFILSIGISSLTVASDIPSLIEDLKDKDKAKDASYALAKIGRPAVPELIIVLEGNNKNQKRYAARAIREMGQNGSDAISTLEKLLKDWDTKTREYVVEALGNMTQQANQVLPMLEKAREDSNEDIRQKAKRSIQNLNSNILQEAQKAEEKIAKEKKENEERLKEQEQDELKRQEDARKQKELAEQEELKVKQRANLTSDSIKVVAVNGNKVYLNYGESVGIGLGQSYAVYVQGKALVDPDTGINLGVAEENIGLVKVVDVQKEFSIAKIMEGNLTEQHKGAICRTLVSIVDKTKIISIKNQKVYLNYGESAGAKIGQLFEVYAKGNALEDPDTGVKLGIENPKVGEIKVTDVQIEYSIAEVVTGALSEMNEGDICRVLASDVNDNGQTASEDVKKASETSQLKIITSKESTAYLNQGKSKGIEVGQTYAVYIQGDALKDPDTGIKLGIEEKRIGIIKVIDVRDDYSIATIVEGLIKEEHRGAICRTTEFEAKGAPAEVQISASVDDTGIYIGQNFAYKIVFDGVSQAGEVDLGPLEKFNPQSGGTSSSTQIINGRIRPKVELTYYLTANESGPTQIPTITVTYDGKKYQTEPVSINVLKPDTTNKMLLNVTLSDEKCYVGQPVIMTLEWIIMTEVKNAGFNVPIFSSDDFYFEDIASDGNTASQNTNLINGIEVRLKEERKTYKDTNAAIISFQKVLIPKKAGKIELAPSSVSAAVAVGVTRQRDFWGNSQYEYKQFMVSSDSLTLEVLPLPAEKKPTEFLNSERLKGSKADVETWIKAEAENYAKQSFKELELTGVVYKEIGGIKKDLDSEGDYTVAVVIDIPEHNDRALIIEVKRFEEQYTIGWDARTATALALLKAGQDLDEEWGKP